jgi:hypothetical protein
MMLGLPFEIRFINLVAKRVLKSNQVMSNPLTLANVY